MELENLEKYLVTAQALAEILKKQPAVVEFMALAKEGKEPSMNNSFCEELLTVTEAAAKLKVGRSRVYEYIKEGLLVPCYTPPASSMKIRVSELNKFIAALPAYQEGGEL